MNSSPRRLAPAVGLGFAALLAAGPVARAGSAPGDLNPVVKTHALYLGADISVQYRGQLRSVVDVRGDSLVIWVDGVAREVPFRRDTVAIQIADVLRVGRTGVTIGTLQVEPTYTAANDPRRIFRATAPGTGPTGAELDQAMAMNNAARGALAAAYAMPDSGPGRTQEISRATQQLSTSATMMDRGVMAAHGGAVTAGQAASSLQAELDQKLFDAIEVTCTVASARPLIHPYLVAIARIHERDAKPGQFRNWIAAQPLESVDSRPQSVRIFQGGMPVGYAIESYRIHVYDGGVEVPTTASARTVPLSLEDAFQYVLIEYRNTHKQDTVRSTFALSAPPADLAPRVAAGEYPATYYVKVKPDGHPAELFIDAACRQPVADAYATSVLRTARFKPALDRGKPVEGVARLTFRQLLE